MLFLFFYFSLLYFTVFMMLTLFEYGERTTTRTAEKFKQWPTVSVIVPAFNEAPTISKVIRSILRSDYPKDKLEVVVVDDGSTDNTKDVVAGFKGGRVTFLSQRHSGKAAAMNLGLSRAKGRFVACLDADSFVPRNTLKHLMVNFCDRSVAAVTPVMEVDTPKTLLQKVQNIEYLLAVYIKKLLSNINSIHVTPGPFSIYKASVIRKIGKFDERSIVEDQEIAYRMQKHNYKIVQSERGEVYTSAPKGLLDLYRQRMRWCKGSWLTFNQYRSMMFNSNYGDFGFFLMPNILFGLVSCFFMLFFFITYFINPMVQALRHFFIAGFYINIGSLFNMSEIASNLLFFTDFYKLSIMWAFAAITVFMLIRSHESLKKDISVYDALPLALFLFAYYMFLSIVNIMSVAELVLKGRREW